MKFIKVIYKDYIKFLLYPSIFFLIGYQLKSSLKVNIDYYLNFSHLYFFLILSIWTFSFLFLKNSKIKIKFENISLLIISASIIGVLLAIIQLDLISTRWLSYGRFDINDADDYFSNSSELLIKKQFYSAKGRILYPIFYTGLMKVFNFNTFNIQIFISLICSITVYFTAYKIKKKFNYFGSLFYCFLSLDFLHENLGGNCTELIGFVVGSIAFILFLEYQFENNLKLKEYFLFFIILLLAYLFRPGPPLILIVFLIIGYFCFLRKNVWKYNLKVLIVPIISILLVFSLDFILRYLYSPNSPTTFINAIDSWYATIELGNYIKEDKYHQIQSQMWNLIYEKNPILIELSGNEFTNTKIKIFLNKLILEPFSFIIGSLFLIKQFFVVPFSYWDPHHNTTSFMFVDFLYLRVVILIFFTIGLVSGLIAYCIKRNNYNLIVFLVGISIVLSQPFVYGGESRTHSSIIGFLWLVSYQGIMIISNFYKKKSLKQLTELNYQSNIINSKASYNFIFFLLFLIILPIFIFILKKGPSNTNLDTKICDSGLFKSTILFNSNSGFILTQDLTKKNITSNYGVDHFLDVFINHLTYRYTFGYKINYPWISKSQIIQRDKFKYLSKLNFLSTPRVHAMDETKFSETYSNIFMIFSKGGGFFIDPIYINNGTQKNIIVLPFDKIKKGVNILDVCLQE